MSASWLTRLKCGPAGPTADASGGKLISPVGAWWPLGAPVSDTCGPLFAPLLLPLLRCALFVRPDVRGLDTPQRWPARCVEAARLEPA